jgi:hypothetical protein
MNADTDAREALVALVGLDNRPETDPGKPVAGVANVTVSTR